jgi:hypothetical protein
MKKDNKAKIYGEVRGQYKQKSVKKRIETLFLDNLRKNINSRTNYPSSN